MHTSASARSLACWLREMRAALRRAQSDSRSTTSAPDFFGSLETVRGGVDTWVCVCDRGGRHSKGVKSGGHRSTNSQADVPG